MIDCQPNFRTPEHIACADTFVQFQTLERRLHVILGSCTQEHAACVGHLCVLSGIHLMFQSLPRYLLA
jgi:hypothetical protein